MSVAEQHKAEVDQGQRFSFGKNWASFLSQLNEDRIALAVKSLCSSLEVDRLDGKTFLDIGSGSGLFSLAARRLGATVFSFDYDTDSVGCTQELRRRFFPDDANWRVEQGSVLDKAYLAKLGTFDIVYSWGVLHHTGSMWDALENVKPLVPVGGKLMIAIYNDQGLLTDRWDAIKIRYNSLPRPLALLYALSVIAKEEREHLAAHIRGGTVNQFVETYTQYHKVSLRGMSRWHDWIDWIGGYPYERATVAKIVDYYSIDGFKLAKLLDRSNGYGCNEFVFNRTGAAGTFVDTPIPGGISFARRFGARIVARFEPEPGGLVARADLPQLGPDQEYFVLSDDRIIEGARVDESGACHLPLNSVDAKALSQAANFVVAAQSVELQPPFPNTRGMMWQTHIGQFADIADRSNGGERNSPVFMFEDNLQLPSPHSAHDDIDRLGGGRFSHWGDCVYFSASDGSDPNTNGRRYRLLVHRR